MPSLEELEEDLSELFGEPMLTTLCGAAVAVTGIEGGALEERAVMMWKGSGGGGDADL